MTNLRSVIYDLEGVGSFDSKGVPFKTHTHTYILKATILS